MDDGESRLQLDQGHIHSAVALESSGNTPEHNSHNFPMPSSRLPEACCPANLNFIMMAQCTNLQRIYIVHMRKSGPKTDNIYSVPTSPYDIKHEIKTKYLAIPNQGCRNFPRTF